MSIPTTTEMRWRAIDGDEMRAEVIDGQLAEFDAWYEAARSDARRQGARQALLDYADLLDGPTYTMDYGSAGGYRTQLLGLLRRDAELLYGDPAAVR